MEEEPIKTSKFLLGVVTVVYADGRIESSDSNLNSGVPDEIIIMKLRKILNKLENRYISNSDSGD